MFGKFFKSEQPKPLQISQPDGPDYTHYVYNLEFGRYVSPDFDEETGLGHTVSAATYNAWTGSFAMNADTPKGGDYSLTDADCDIIAGDGYTGDEENGTWK